MNFYVKGLYRHLTGSIPLSFWFEVPEVIARILEVSRQLGIFPSVLGLSGVQTCRTSFYFDDEKNRQKISNNITLKNQNLRRLLKLLCGRNDNPEYFYGIKFANDSPTLKPIKRSPS
ncbi:hypothetical protein AVEN_203165-1 [Araneus ventricosus]|uniref:Uncharacterized protein n=1 Tax=Araneus ventricosus TaxID=182803 RepID=A0A4Y2CHC5_ARAVE|nr:hypothetical protein AVEN_203165-1 [Araneus ventricosus]